MANAILVEWPDSSLIKVVESPHLPYIKTYRVATDFPTLANAQAYIDSVLYAKTSGDTLDAGDWTQAEGKGLDYPGHKIPTQAEADRIAAEAKAEEGFETVHYADGSSAYGVKPMPRTNEHGSPAV